MTTEENAPYEIKLSNNPEETPWFQSDVESVLRPQTREMLDQYAHVPPDRMIKHIEEARRKAWDLAPYASIGALTWLNSYLTLHPAHSTILQRVKEGASILDCGCMVAPDLRQLAFEGAPTEHMYGFDIEPGFFPIGYDFYQDRETFKGSFLTADVTAELDETPLGMLKGKLDIVWCAKFLHIFDRSRQIQYAAKLISLLKPQPGSMFVVSQNGLPSPQHIPMAGRSPIWMADEETVKQDWAEVAKLTETEWDLQTSILDLRSIGLHKDDGSIYKKHTGHTVQWTATRL